jgi:hypothetical protein
MFQLQDQDATLVFYQQIKAETEKNNDNPSKGK